MKIKQKLLLIILHLAVICKAQNLIYNGDFEICNGDPNCNNLPNGQSQFSYVDGWTGDNITPDWFKDNGNHDVPNSTTDPYSCIGMYAPEAIDAHSGSHYVGIFDHEEITYDFGSNLPEGQYRLTFWARGCSMSAPSGGADNSYWGVSVYASPGPLRRNPFYHNSCDNISKQERMIYSQNFLGSVTTSWQKIEFTFNTYGVSNRYLTITGLRDVTCGRYLFLDDVKMEDICCSDYMLYQATSSLPALTQRKDYIWAGYNVGCANIPPGNVTVKSFQNVKFVAAAPQVFPGFNVEPGGVFLMVPGDCEIEQPIQSNYEITLVDYTNGVYFSCNHDPQYSAGFVAKNATYYRIKIFDNWGSKVLEQEGPIHEQSIIYSDGSNISTCFLTETFVVQLELWNCVTGAHKVYGYSLYFEYQYSTYGCAPLHFCDCPFINCGGGKKENELASKDSVNLVPNPNSDFVTVNFFTNEAKPFTIELYSITGVKVYSIPINSVIAGNNSFTLNLENISAGSYIVKLVAKDFSYSNKFVNIK